MLRSHHVWNSRHGSPVHVVLLLTLWLFVTSVSVQASSWGSGWFGVRSSTRSSNDGNATSNSDWSSFLTVDPSKLVSLLVKKGGMLIPESYYKDELKACAKVCHAELVQLNMVQRTLLVHNLTVQLPGEKETALRIGRIQVLWDSYLRPCVEVQVDNVGILVEFLNVLLTKNNWSELQKAGFPPRFSYEEEEDDGLSNATSFVRIGSVDLSGNVEACLKSRPLQRQISALIFDLDAFDPLDREIREQSLENLAKTGRRGCTTDELYDLIQSYFGKRLRQALAKAVTNISDGDEGSIQEKASKVVDSTKQSAGDLVDKAFEWSEKQLQRKVIEQLNTWGNPTSDKFYGKARRKMFAFARKVRHISRQLIRKKDETAVSYDMLMPGTNDVEGVVDPGC